MAKKTKPESGMHPNNTLVVEQSRNESGAQAMARKVMDPGMRHALTASAFAGEALGDLKGPDLMDYIRYVLNAADKCEAGELALASRTLIAQAITLDSMFTELARRSAANMGEYLDASERYARLALKAQANSRSTLEALAKLHQPREQIVKHVHVNDGGQAVVANQIHQHEGEGQNEKTSEQSHATGTSGDSPLKTAALAVRDQSARTDLNNLQTGRKC